MTKTATENGPSPKRIILCLDGAFDDTADTVERVYPGSSVSRFFRWLLPPFVFMIIWGSGIFPLWKKLEKKILGQPDKKPFHTNVSLLASAIKSHGCWDGHSAQKPQLVM
ncbi:hypothetical protein DL95DRAFT_138609 [Leptodontidium sp. 2 PMI_412]|nr:hypothetical protein DL95DRAFT_138609 [Leptodontidium sp. 2 PMI_412]